MQSSGSNFDISGFKALVDETPSADNGWVLDYDGVARKDHPGSKHFSFFLLIFLFRKSYENLQKDHGWRGSCHSALRRLL